MAASAQKGRTMSRTPPDSPGSDARLNAVIAAYLEAAEAGQPPDRDAWIAQHPDLADDLRAFFANHDRMAQAGGPLRDVPSAEVPAAEVPTLPFGTTPTDPTLEKVRYFG